MTATFNTQVRDYMNSPVMTILESQPAPMADEKLANLGISAIAVVDPAGSLVGVVSRTDLLRSGRVRPPAAARRRALWLPEVPVREIMTSSVEIVAPNTTLADAARHMVKQHIHRLYVSEDRRPQGVVSTKEITQAVIDARLKVPLEEVMHRAVIEVRAADPLSLVIDRMDKSYRHGLVVVEDGWPVGVFTQADALAARAAEPSERVDGWMNPRILCLPMKMPVFRAAEQAIATRARRVLATDGAGVRGIVSELDFARLVMG